MAASGVREVAVAKLRCAERNPRKISAARLEQLKRSLEADREMLRARPLVALPDGTVLMGNMRLRAVQELGWKTVPVLTVELDDARARLWMLRDNQGYGEWDEPLLSELLAELQGEGVDLDLSGFGERELVSFLASVGGGHQEPDVVPEPPAEPRSRVGEVYELGLHRLMCGDASNAGHVETLVAGETATLLITDPPYGVDYAGLVSSRKNQKKDGWMDIEGDATSDDELQALLTATLSGWGATTAFVWHPAGARRFLFWRALEENGWRIAQEIIWVKNALVFGRADYQWQHEPCLYAKKQGARSQDDRTATTVWEEPKPTSSIVPTQKPVGLFRRSVLNHTDPGEIVVDPFAGSGTALIAAEETGRRALTMEVEPRWCDVIRQRYADYTGRPELAP